MEGIEGNLGEALEDNSLVEDLAEGIEEVLGNSLGDYNRQVVLAVAIATIDHLAAFEEHWVLSSYLRIYINWMITEIKCLTN